MSWLYTVLFAGLVFSSQGASDPASETCTLTDPISLEKQILDETEKFEQTYKLNANGRVNISNINGSITISAWDRNEVKLEYTKIADTKERLSDVEIRVDTRSDYFSVETDYGNWKGKNTGDRWQNNGKLSVEFKLSVPRGAVLNEVETVNGSVNVSNFTNVTKVSAINGTVNATNIRGTANLSTVNGQVTAEFDQIESGSKISLETVNGQVKLIIPSDSNATLKADSLNGSISNDFGLTVRKGKYVGRDLYGRLGNGDVQIKLSSVNGGLTINRKADGKNQSPVTNLLPLKERGSDDWDDTSLVNSDKIEKDIAKALKNSSKDTSKAIAEVQKEMKKLEPELAKIASDSLAAAAGAIAQTAQLIGTEAIQEKLIEAQLMQKEAMARMGEATYFPMTPRIERKSESFPVKGTPKVDVTALGCAVSIKGWDRPEVEYRVTQFADTRLQTPLNIKENHSDSAVTLKIENPDFRRGQFFSGSSRVRVEVFVPRKSNLKINTDGEIRIEGVSGDVELAGGDEPVNVRDVEGKLKIQNSDGRIRVIGFSGDMEARTDDGSISLEGDFKSLKAHATDGAITITLPENASADIETNREVMHCEGIRLNKISGNNSSRKYRLGTGGALYQVTTDGEIHIRGAGVLTESK